MSAVQNLKSVVTLGGAVDASFKGMASEVDKQLGGATKQVKTLEREQKSLTKQIRKAKLAGADVSFLTKKYESLSEKIGKANETARGFQASSNFKNSLKSAVGYIAATAAGVVGLTGTVIGLTTATNAATAEQNGLAKAYGMSIDQFKAWGGVAEQAGLNAENTGDLVEELTNKFGEFKALGKQSSVSDVFGALGIDKSMMDGLNAAEQFEFVMHRLEKVKDSQKAASLADMLFGGEGNKVITYIRNSGKSLDELLDTQRSINNLTQKGADGALRYNTAWKSVTSALYSGWQDVSGIVGGELAPLLDEFTVSVSQFYKENKQDIVDFLKSAVTGSLAFAKGVFTLAGAVNSVVQSIGGWQTVTALIAGLMAGKMVLGIAGVISNVQTMISVLGAVKTTMLGVNAVMAANPIGAVALAVGVLTAAVVANWDTIVSWCDTIKGAFASIKEWLGFTDDKKSEVLNNASAGHHRSSSFQSPVNADDSGYYGTRALPSTYSPYNYASRAQQLNETAGSSSDSRVVHQRVDKIEIVAAPGQSPEEVGQVVANRLSDHQNAMFDLTTGD